MKDLSNQNQNSLLNSVFYQHDTKAKIIIIIVITIYIIYSY